MSTLPRVLVVEDETAIQELLRYTLVQAGFDAVIVGSAEQAMAEINHELPAVVLLDMMLPGISGTTLAKRLRGEARTRDLPIIMVTARAEESSRVQGLDLGADDYVVKPFSHKELAARINRDLSRHIFATHRVTSRLELEFERLYLKLFLPSMRHGTAGARKRYAGLVEEGGKKRVIFVGMESVRSDWTDLSKEFQKGLYERVFSGEPVEDFVREYVERLKSGGCDDLLVYRKVLRKPLDQYVETTPPHVKAARMLPKVTGRLVHYVMTVDGPQPAGFRESPFDYEHYVEKQLEPVADAVLAHLGASFRAILGGERQMDLF